jgi:hypothetical protein
MTDINGDAVFGGEFTNETGASFVNYRVNVAFVENGTVQDSKVVEGCPHSYVNGKSIFFSGSSNDADPDHAAGLANIAINSTLKVGTPVDTNMELTNLDVTRKDDLLRVTGHIDGDSSDDVDNARVCVVVWDQDDNVIVVGQDNSTIDVPEDGTETFSVDVTVPDDTDLVDHVDVYVDGSIGNDLTEAVLEDNQSVDVCANPTNTPTGTPPTSTPTTTATATPTGSPTATATPDNAC